METTPNHRETRTLNTLIKKKTSVLHTETRTCFYICLDVWSHCGAPPPPNKPLGWCVLSERLSFFTVLNNYKASLFLSKQTVLAIQCTGTFTLVLHRVIKWAAEGCCSYIQIELSDSCMYSSWLGWGGGAKIIDQAIFIKYSCGNALWKPSSDYK